MPGGNMSGLFTKQKEASVIRAEESRGRWWKVAAKEAGLLHLLL